jgi:hypothetical protein
MVLRGWTGGLAGDAGDGPAACEDGAGVTPVIGPGGACARKSVGEAQATTPAITHKKEAGYRPLIRFPPPLLVLEMRGRGPEMSGGLHANGDGKLRGQAGGVCNERWVLRLPRPDSSET